VLARETSTFMNSMRLLPTSDGKLIEYGEGFIFDTIDLAKACAIRRAEADWVIERKASREQV